MDGVKCFHLLHPYIAPQRSVGALPRQVHEPRHDKTNKMSVRPAKTQISLGIRPVCSESSLCAQSVAKDPWFLHADSEDSDQPGHPPSLDAQADLSLRCVHSLIVGFVMSRLTCTPVIQFPPTKKCTSRHENVKQLVSTIQIYIAVTWSVSLDTGTQDTKSCVCDHVPGMSTYA